MQQNIEMTINGVLGLVDLTPNPAVNAAMTGLVDSVIRSSEVEMAAIDTPTVVRIRNISARAEAEMEKFWARRIITAPSPERELALFPYLGNYTELTKRELGLIKESGLHITSSHAAVVIGSGPLPLTAFEIRRQSGAIVDHVDSSSEAIELCEEVNQVLSVRSTHYHASGENVALSKQYDLILIAALAGNTQQDKQAIIDNILSALDSNGRIVVRSARGARELLYPAIEARSLRGVKLLGEYHPDDHVINSVLVYGKI